MTENAKVLLKLSNKSVSGTANHVFRFWGAKTGETEGGMHASKMRKNLRKRFLRRLYLFLEARSFR